MHGGARDLGTDSENPIWTNNLQAGSPAIDAGSPLGAPTADFENRPRVRVVDIGAFEGP